MFPSIYAMFSLGVLKNFLCHGPQTTSASGWGPSCKPTNNAAEYVKKHQLLELFLYFSSPFNNDYIH